jgi:membrane-bound lytic murein transglycosylase D
MRFIAGLGLLFILHTGAFSQSISLEGFLVSSIEKMNPLSYPDLYYEIHLANLNTHTDLNLFFDEDVKNYIDIYLMERTDQLPDLKQNIDIFFPLFEKYLEEFNLPEEIKYLPIIESGLSPFACSPSMAVGLWQFKKETAEYFGLSVNDFLDEREDPELSTLAACKYLSSLYTQFEDWDLALLAYNAGPSSIRKAIKMAHGSKEYQYIYPWLSEPAKKYLPALNAVIYLFNNYENHFPENTNK